MQLPRLAITIGDPAGIGPEVVFKALKQPALYRLCRPIVIGSAALFPSLKNLQKNPHFTFLDVPVPGSGTIVPGRFSKITGACSYEYILKALELIAAGNADALVTAPISKEALLLSGVRFPGHTELLAALSATKKFAMLMIAGHLRLAMVTRHIPLADVSKNLSIDAIKEATQLAFRFVQSSLKIQSPKIAVCALNPHAGEGGLLGKEERTVILPALKALKEEGIPVVGPLPADSAWQKLKSKKFDVMITLYHDQAMIGLKCLAPQKIVNVTAGLPFIRTSPGHGTGFDIAGKNIADPRSMAEAMTLAAQLAKTAKKPAV